MSAVEGMHCKEWWKSGQSSYSHNVRMVCDVIEQMEKKSGISYRLVICILKQDCVCVCVCAPRTCIKYCCPFWQRIRLRERWLWPDSLSGQCKNQIFYPRILLGMNLWSLSMILRWNVSPSDGTPTYHLERRNFGSQNLSRRSFRLLFSTVWLWCTTNSSV